MKQQKTQYAVKQNNGTGEHIVLFTAATVDECWYYLVAHFPHTFLRALEQCGTIITKVEV